METVKKNRIVALDGIRGLAIVMVVIYHYGYSLLDAKDSVFNAYFKLFTKYFFSSIDLFFVLSGFLLGTILLTNKTNPNYFTTFYIRRICRILPIYFLSILAVYSISFFGIGANTIWSFDYGVPWYSYLFFAQNFFMALQETFGNRFLVVTWSLAVEEQFYLILPLLIYFLNRKSLIILLCIFIISAPIFRKNASNFYEAFVLVHCRFDSLFAGVVIAIASMNLNFMNFCNKYSTILGTVLIVLLALTAAFMLQIFKVDYYYRNTWFAFLYSILFVIIITSKNNLFSVLMRNKFLIITGKYSFGIYIYHQIVLGLLFFALRDKAPKIEEIADVIVVLLSFLITMLISFFSFNYLEAKIIRFGHKFNY